MPRRRRCPRYDEYGVFSNACGSNCNITINTTTQAYEFLGMELSSNYTGTITLAGSNTFTLKTNGLACRWYYRCVSTIWEILISEFDYNRIGVNLTGGQFVAPSEFEVLYKPPAHEEQTGFKATSDHTFVKGTGLVRFHVSLVPGLGVLDFSSTYLKTLNSTILTYIIQVPTTDPLELNSKQHPNITISHDLTENIPLLRGGTFNVYNNYNQGDRLLGYRYMANLTNATVALVGSNSVEYSCAYLSDVNIGPILQINKTGGATVTPKQAPQTVLLWPLRVLAGQFTAPSNFLQIGEHYHLF